MKKVYEKGDKVKISYKGKEFRVTVLDAFSYMEEAYLEVAFDDYNKLTRIVKEKNVKDCE